MESKVPQDELVAWVGRHILPHEARLRAWLRSAFSTVEIDDVVQEAYCRISALACTDHIIDPCQYFFAVARNVVLEQVRRQRVVKIEAIGNLADLEGTMSEEVFSPERVVAGRLALQRVEALIGLLPERTRRVIQMRKIEGCAQTEIAIRLGLSISVVENELTRGISRVLHSLSEAERAELPARASRRRPRFKRSSHGD
jgi:RNA polymerase sigma factor (sigma-70 family)